MQTEQASIDFLPLSAIRKSPTNPRKRFPEAEHLELVESVRVHGILQPVLVRPWPEEPGMFELVAGERRFRAATAVELETVPALVRDLSDDEVLQIQIVENLQRRDLHPLEEADGYKVLSDRGHTLEQIAKEVSQTRTYVAQRLKLCALNASTRKLFHEEKLNASTALMIARLPTDLQDKAAKELTAPWANGEPRSIRAASEHIQRTYMLRLDEAPFKTSDETLVPSAGACGPCPKRTGNQVDMFGDVKSKEICTDPSCYAKKKEAGAALKRAEAEAAGRKVITGKEAKAALPDKYSSLQGGLVKLDETCYDDLKHRSYRQIIGAKGVKSAALLESPHDGKLIDVMPKADLKKMLADKGIQARSTGTSNPSQSAELAKKKAADAYRGELFNQVRDKHEGTGLSDFDLKIVAVTFYRRLWNENQKRICKLHGWGSKAITEAEFAKKVDAIEAASREDPEGLGRLVMDIALIDESVAATYSTGKPELLEATARDRGIDPGAVRKQVETDMRPKPKEKPVPAKKAPPASPKPTAKAAAAKRAPAKRPAAKKVVAKPASKASSSAAPAQADNAKPSLKDRKNEPWPFPNTGRP
ncbi:Nucleoid occlusion protein [Paraburkholderia caffeinitolerans]|uniref:Nucleoid occlusion protein n=1 Tax=Paraburkholderia caffeinitolerans TaxID=1723730 RepID=A0A6J5FMU5_9BURK|nr:ParB/RepB/Spo0J family partition protein [Paraburkholderia caffeinitolerans]CAB3783086.1 Nucleoid occlusion protein [Paraburkholderia caffeinitolerans]